MPNQDLLFSILPRPPIAPGKGEFHPNPPIIEKEPVTKKTEVHKDPAEHAPQDDYHPASGHQQQESAADEESLTDSTHAQGSEEDGQEHVDLFV